MFVVLGSEFYQAIKATSNQVGIFDFLNPGQIFEHIVGLLSLFGLQSDQGNHRVAQFDSVNFGTVPFYHARLHHTFDSLMHGGARHA